MFDALKRTYGKAKAKAIAVTLAWFGSMDLGNKWNAEALEPFQMGSTRGQANMADEAVSIVVAIVVAGLLAAFLLPIAIEEIAGVDTTSWDSDGAAALWDVLPVLIVLAIFLFFVTVAVSNRNGN